jgi:hypothetical protein
MGLVELDEALPNIDAPRHRFLTQTLIISGGEFMDGMFLTRSAAAQLFQTPRVALKIFLIL